jgi:hypothetical protein
MDPIMNDEKGTTDPGHRDFGLRSPGTLAPRELPRSVTMASSSRALHA